MKTAGGVKSSEKGLVIFLRWVLSLPHTASTIVFFDAPLNLEVRAPRNYIAYRAGGSVTLPATYSTIAILPEFSRR